MIFRHFRPLVVLAAVLTTARAQDLPPVPGPVDRLKSLLADTIHPPKMKDSAGAAALCGSGERVRVKATLLFETGPGVLFMQDDAGLVRALLEKPILARTGDVIEVTGLPELFQSAPNLRKAGVPGNPWLLTASAVNLGPGELPTPLNLDFARIYDQEEHRAALDTRLVQVTGKVTGYTTNSTSYGVASGQYRVNYDVAILDCGRRVDVYMKTGRNLKELLPLHETVTVSGMLRLESEIPKDHAGQINVMTGGPTQVRIHQAPVATAAPGMLQRNLIIAGAVAGGIVVLVGAWALFHRAHFHRLRLANAELERRVAERTAELESALARQTELAKLKTDFVSLVSHEFRTPLGVVMSAADVLDRYYERLAPEKRRRHLDMVKKSTSQLASLIEEVLVLSRVEEGRVHFQPAALDVEKLCRTVVDELHSATGGASPIRFQTLNSLEGAQADESLLRHILTNLISNACKYSEPGQPVDFTAERDGIHLVLAVRDHGIGIPAEDQARLFTSFTRGGNVGQRPGTGLGLVIVQRCVRLHGGEIRIQSTEGEGTGVTVTLPAWNGMPGPNS